MRLVDKQNLKEYRKQTEYRRQLYRDASYKYKHIIKTTLTLLGAVSVYVAMVLLTMLF